MILGRAKEAKPRLSWFSLCHFGLSPNSLIYHPPPHRSFLFQSSHFSSCCNGPERRRDGAHRGNQRPQLHLPGNRWSPSARFQAFDRWFLSHPQCRRPRPPRRIQWRRFVQLPKIQGSRNFSFPFVLYGSWLIGAARIMVLKVSDFTRSGNRGSGWCSLWCLIDEKDHGRRTVFNMLLVCTISVYGELSRDIEFWRLRAELKMHL